MVTRRASNRYLDAIAALVGESGRSKAVEGLVRHYRAPGESLESIASNLGVSQIVEEDLPFEGGIYVRENTLVIKVNSLSVPVRRRFTLAHEIGHLMLSAKLKGATRCSRNRKLEDACDAIAAELLMPAEAVVSYVTDLSGPSPENLRLVARRFDVSLQTAALRVHYDLKLWPESIGLWQYDEKRGGTQGGSGSGFSDSPRECWFVGERRWKTKYPPFRVFFQALNSSNPERSRESYFEDSVMKPIALEVLHLGRGRLLGIVA